jgi:hypothetical protein
MSAWACVTTFFAPSGRESFAGSNGASLFVRSGLALVDWAAQGGEMQARQPTNAVILGDKRAIRRMDGKSSTPKTMTAV